MDTIGESLHLVNRVEEFCVPKNRLTAHEPYVTCSAIFILKMGSVSDLTLLQVPVGYTRHIRVSSSIHCSDIRLYWAGYVTARGR